MLIGNICQLLAVSPHTPCEWHAPFHPPYQSGNWSVTDLPHSRARTGIWVTHEGVRPCASDPLLTQGTSGREGKCCSLVSKWRRDSGWSVAMGSSQGHDGSVMPRQGPGAGVSSLQRLFRLPGQREGVNMPGMTPSAVGSIYASGFNFSDSSSKRCRQVIGSYFGTQGGAGLPQVNTAHLWFECKCIFGFKNPI